MRPPSMEGVSCKSNDARTSPRVSSTLVRWLTRNEGLLNSRVLSLTLFTRTTPNSSFALY